MCCDERNGASDSSISTNDNKQKSELASDRGAIQANRKLAE